MAEKKNHTKKTRHEKYIKVREYNGNTYFTVQFTYDTQDGKAQYSKTFNAKDYKTPGEALAAACAHRDKKRAELANYGLPKTGNRTVGEIWEDYCRIHRTGADGRRLEQSTAKYILKDHAYIDIKSISPVTITAHLESLKFDCSQKVLARIATTWRKIIKQALLEGLITRDPMEMVIVPRSEKAVTPRQKVCSDEDIEKVIDALAYAPVSLDKQYLYHSIILVIKVMKYTGLRPGECYSLKRTDVDRENNLIYISSRAGKDEKGNVIRKKAKTETSVRAVPMNKECAMAMYEALARSKGDYIFTYANGKMLDSNEVSYIVNKAAQSVGVKFNLYMLRHNVASTLITSNVDPRTVMELLGHSNINMTVGTYARSTEALKSQAVESLVQKRTMMS